MRLLSYQTKVVHNDTNFKNDTKPRMDRRTIRTKLITKSRFHGHGFEASLETLERHASSAESIELYSKDNVAFLDIRFGELFHRCSSEEWGRFIAFLKESNFILDDLRFPWRSIGWRLLSIIGWLIFIKLFGRTIGETLSGYPDIIRDGVLVISVMPLVWLALGIHHLLTQYFEDSRVAKLVKHLMIEL